MRRLLANRPDDRVLVGRLVAAYDAAEDWAAVERTASPAIASGSDDIMLWIRRGWARLHLGRLADAAADFRETMGRQPRSTLIRLMLFAAVSELGNHNEADTLWRAVMSDRSGSRAESWVSISSHLQRLADARPKNGWLLRAGATP